MLADPTGGSMHMDEVLPLLPVPNYISPGLFLIIVMGLLLLLLIYALLARPDWFWFERLSNWSGLHWAWIAVIALGVEVLVIFLILQAILIGFNAPIQFVTVLVGLLILLFGLSPGVSRYYAS